MIKPSLDLLSCSGSFWIFKINHSNPFDLLSYMFLARQMDVHLGQSSDLYTSFTKYGGLNDKYTSPTRHDVPMRLLLGTVVGLLLLLGISIRIFTELKFPNFSGT